MLAGLLFATHDAEDRPDKLAATLPFGGVTLIEYQARLLIAAGASQIIVAVARLTPELLGAISRIGRRGVTVDAVRSATEASEKLHPLARVLMLGDGLLTTESVVATLAGEGRDALLVVPETEARPGFERVGGNMAWAGVARLDPRRIAEVAALPHDYDLQSTLLRLAAQAHATHLLLPGDALRNGHGIELRASGLAERGRAVLAAIVSDRRGWFDRWILAPVARLVLPVLVARGTTGGTLAAVGAALGIGGLAGIVFGWTAAGLVAAFVATMVLALGSTLSGLRDEPGLTRGQVISTALLPAVAVLFLGADESGRVATHTPLVVAFGLVVAGVLGERAILERLRWLAWGSPPAYLLVVTLATLAGAPMVGLAVAAAYAVVTLAGAVEVLRRRT